jgi:hypothetical protein
MKEKNDLEGVQEMSIDQLHMYQLTPKKTFKKKNKPPLDIVIFKVIRYILNQGPLYILYMDRTLKLSNT